MTRFPLQRGFQTTITPLNRRCLSHFRVVEHIVPASYVRTYPGAIDTDAENSLRLAVKQYIPLTQSASALQSHPVTVVGGHANGFPKELYEPLWDDLYENLSARGVNVQSIWIADVANQGASGGLNESVLGNDPNWWDHARDLMYLINRKQGQMPQPIIGVGHSMGASILTALALLHPSLFQTLVLIEPVIQIENPSKGFAPPSTYRRDQWPSREAAVEAFTKSKFYQAWDKRVLDEWLKHGLREEPSETDTTQHEHTKESAESPHRVAAFDGPREEDQRARSTSHPTTVKLSTTKAQEVFHYLRPLYKAESASASLRRKIYPDIDPSTLEPGYDFYRPEPVEIFNRLPHLRPSVLYCFGKSSPLATPDLRRQKLETTGTAFDGSSGAEKGRHVKQTLFDTGHMLPFEQVNECAQVAASWISDQVATWQACHDEWAAMWRNLTVQEKRDIDDEWLKRMPRPEKKTTSTTTKPNAK